MKCVDHGDGKGAQAWKETGGMAPEKLYGRRIRETLSFFRTSMGAPTEDCTQNLREGKGPNKV